MFSSSKSAFIACPGAESVALELEIIKIILEDSGFEPYIAIENYDPAKDVFCEKICTRIIESKLCVVLLTDPMQPNGQRYPNPNVYYEYGLMTSFGKPIIPLQRADHELAFNVRSLDTIKYTNFDLKRLLERVIGETIQGIVNDERKAISTGEPNRVLHLFMELQGYGMTNSHFVHGTPFKQFRTPGGEKYKYGILIRNEDDMSHIRTHLILLGTRLNNILEKRKKRIEILQWDANNAIKSNSPQNVREVDRAIKKTQVEIDSIEKYTEFVIVCANSEKMQHDIEEEVVKIRDSFNLQVRIRALDELYEQTSSITNEV